MNAIIFFLLKVSLCLIVLYLPYAVLFRKTTFFILNRFYLLGCLLLSFIFPVINIETPAVTQSLAVTFVQPIQFTPDSWIIKNSNTTTGGVDYMTIVVAIYVLGVVVYLIPLLRSIGNVISLRKSGTILQLDGFKMVQTKNAEVFTFFNFIFLPDNVNDPSIINHEKVHIKQLHWIDLLIVEVASAILWFNPVMIFIRRSIKLQHEYCADQNSAVNDHDLVGYLHCLVEQCNPVKATRLISQFNYPLIKKRINMLTQERTPVARRWTYLVLLPVTIFILAAFSNRKVYTVLGKGETDSTQQTELVFVSPLENDDLKISSEFGNRMHPMFKKMMMHTGVDFVSAEGEEVIAPEAGVVVKSVFLHSRGNYIVIRHDDTYSTSYSHLKDRMVQEGEHVKKAQVIGLVGNTGLSVSSHLHYEVLRNGDPIDPTPFLTKK